MDNEAQLLFVVGMAMCGVVVVSQVVAFAGHRTESMVRRSSLFVALQNAGALLFFVIAVAVFTTQVTYNIALDLVADVGQSLFFVGIAFRSMRLAVVFDVLSSQGTSRDGRSRQAKHEPTERTALVSPMDSDPEAHVSHLPPSHDLLTSLASPFAIQPPAQPPVPPLTGGGGGSGGSHLRTYDSLLTSSTVTGARTPFRTVASFANDASMLSVIESGSEEKLSNVWLSKRFVACVVAAVGFAWSWHLVHAFVAPTKSKDSVLIELKIALVAIGGAVYTLVFGYLMFKLRAVDGRFTQCKEMAVNMLVCVTSRAAIIVKVWSQSSYDSYSTTPVILLLISLGLYALVCTWTSGVVLGEAFGCCGGAYPGETALFDSVDSSVSSVSRRDPLFEARLRHHDVHTVASLTRHRQ